METKKSRVFAKKLLAIFMAVLMAMTAFTGALSAYAASVDSDKDYHDDNLAANFMAWAETTDEQTAEALLDWADLHISDIATSLMGSDHLYFSQNVVVATITIDAYLDSVDGIIDLVGQADSLLNSYGGLIGGDVNNIDLSPLADLSSSTSNVVSKCGKSYRSNNSAKEIIMALAEVLYINSNDVEGKNVIGQFVKGQLSLGNILTSALGNNVYGLLQSSLNMWDGYEYNIVYNIVANLILSNTDWFTDDEKATYYADLKATSASNRTYAWNFDKVLIKALNEKLLQKISVLVTYPSYYRDSSTNQYINRSTYTLNKDGIVTLNKNNVVTSDNYKGIVYSTQYADKNGVLKNIYLFQYDEDGDGEISASEKLTLEDSDTLFTFSYKALKFAWKTVLKETINTMHVNYSNESSKQSGTNFDNVYFYWTSENIGWSYDDVASNYSEDNINAFAAANYEAYGYKDAAAMIQGMKDNLNLDRTAAADSKGTWKDVDATTLFRKLRFSPLAAYGFNMTTGPINLYFEQTGATNLEDFFANDYDSYSNLVSGFNDALVAACNDFFPNNSHIGYTDANGFTNVTRPTLTTTGDLGEIDDVDVNTIATTLVKNIMVMFEYAANATDANLLKGYYSTTGYKVNSYKLTEDNFESAMMPLLISCINQISLTKVIHDEKWDSCKDAESVAIVCLEEYLSYVLPEKDYSILWSYDSNGYMIPATGINNDQDEDGDYDLFDAIMIMSRDAVSYLVQSIVPCCDANWEEWDVYKRDVNDTTTLLDIANSVLCYYGSSDTFDNTGYKAGSTTSSKGKGVAAILGVVDSNGASLVKKTNDLWTNVDAVANKLLPILGVIQYGSSDKSGKFSSKDLIWNDLVNGILEISSSATHTTGNKGITNLIQRVLTMFTSYPIQYNNGKASLDVMLYDIVADEVNAVFGARYSGQIYDKVIPNASFYDTDDYADTSSSTPFDALLTTSTLGHYDVCNNSTYNDKDTGVVGILIYTLYGIFGTNKQSPNGTYNSTMYAASDGAWDGAMFAVESVNNFIPAFVPQISDHSLNAATAEIANPSQSGLTQGSSFTATTLDITNNSIGLNRFYRDANGNVNQDGRYFVNITGIEKTSTNNDASNVTIGSYNSTVAPESTVKVPITGTAPSGSQTYTFTITYDIYQAKEGESQTADNTLFTGLQTKAYLYLSCDKDWQNTLYSSTDSSDSSKYTYNEDYNVAWGSSAGSNEYVQDTAKFGTSNQLWAGVPKDFIISISDTKKSDPTFTHNTIRLTNTSSKITGSTRAMDGIYTYLSKGTKYYAVSGSTVSDTLTTASDDNTTMAYAAIDKSNGNILNYALYDYKAGDDDWVRGDTATAQSTTQPASGYTASEIQTIKDNLPDGTEFATRTHVAYTFAEACSLGLVTGVQREAAALDSNGNQTYTYQAVYVTPNTTLLQGSYSNSSKNSISWGTPTPGIYFSAGKTDVSKNSTSYIKFISYDGTTSLSADDYAMNVFLYTTNNQNGKATINMHIADDSATNELQSKYSSASTTASTYQSSDMKDVDEEGLSETYTSLQEALAGAVKAISTPINASNASKLGSVYETVAQTKETTSALHSDVAYMPVSTDVALPASVQLNATKGDDGYWYYNDECTLPVYGTTEVTESDLTNKTTVDGAVAGYTPVGDFVVQAKDEDDNYHFYLQNAKEYETEWDTTTFSAPYETETDVQATDANDNPLYKQIRYYFKDVDGKNVASTDKWVVKVPMTEEAIKANDYENSIDYRGIYQLQIDNLDYCLALVKKNVNADIASKIGEGVSEDREGLSNVNYNVASYEKMVQIAKDAEALVSQDGVKYYALDEEGNLLKDKDGNNVEVTLSEDYSTSLIKIYVDADNNQYRASQVTEKGNYVTTHSSIEIDTAYAMYQEFKSYVQPRGFIGDKLFAEIKCASGVAYTNLTATTVDETTGVGAVKTTATEVKYGKVENGEIVNDGYTDDSWNAYITALDNAVACATAGKDDLSDIYEYKKSLQLAENNLTEVTAPKTITVSGTIAISTNTTGTDGTVGIAGIDIKAGDEVVATSAADGTFTAEVPVGTTELTVAGSTTVDRTVTLTGTANVADVTIPVVICDYNHDGYINVVDMTSFNSAYGKSVGTNIYCNFNGDGYVNVVDMTAFNSLYGKTISYSALALD